MMNDKQKVIFADIIAAIIAGDEEKTKSLISDYSALKVADAIDNPPDEVNPDEVNPDEVNPDEIKTEEDDDATDVSKVGNHDFDLDTVNVH